MLGPGRQQFVYCSTSSFVQLAVMSLEEQFQTAATMVKQLNKTLADEELKARSQTSTGPYRSCAALLDISNLLKDLLEFGFMDWFGWF